MMVTPAGFVMLLFAQAAPVGLVSVALKAIFTPPGDPAGVSPGLRVPLPE